MSGGKVALAVAVPPGLLPAREQMALTLGFHIVLACFGVAFPTIIFLMHRRGILRNDPVALRLARRWAKVSGLLFAVGAVSGTVLSFEMGLLWPGLMGRFGDVLGLPFAIYHSIGPVWEANHVWLIYVLVMWWSGFPIAFAATMTTFSVPLMLALAGIVLRGSSFTLRKHAATFALARLFGAVFAGSSLITPFFFGTIVGGIASGRVPASGYGERVGSWINPTSLLGGGLASATCVFLAGVFLTADAARVSNTPLAERLRTRTLAVGNLSGAIVFAGLDLVLHDAPTLSHGLLHAGYPLLIVAAIAGAGALVLLYLRNYSATRWFAVADVASVVAGWGIGQYPWMLVDQLTIDDAAGAPTTLAALLVVVGLAVVFVLPPLVLLLRLTQRVQQRSPHDAAYAETV